jgi:hypothetical protein
MWCWDCLVNMLYITVDDCSHDQGRARASRQIRTSMKYAATLALALATIALPSILVQDQGIASASAWLKHDTISAQLSPASSSGLITAGPSRDKCVTLSSQTPTVPNFEAVTGTSVSCVNTYANGSQTWAQWESPWILAPSAGETDWVAGDPGGRQIVVQVNLIPNNLDDVGNPLGWEKSCAAGQFNAYALQLGTNLVAAGLQNSVIRLGAEMNGPWEGDFVGTTTVEQNLWATCFANEVTSLRRVTGEHFLVDWNPNSCYENIPYVNYYPGNAYVDILGLDFYDQSCMTPTVQVSWAQLSNLPAGLLSFETFAKEHGKPMSFPEWGLVKTPGDDGDNPAYINGVGSTFDSGDFAFESYFDPSVQGTLPIGPATPLSLAAFQKWF